MREYSNLDETIALNIIGVQLPIAEVYTGLAFPPAAPGN